ncbi:MAG: DivIVA domain-containing protein [Gemmatimonadaceae bacterium]|nr:DivIVA domain-containing protein [Gemmatimonadaceae bacterium]
MSDEQFRLTPLDVRRWEFGSALRGYDRARVDEFKVRVADEIEELARRINDLDTKARGFHEQIRSFRERDRAINDALVSAQQLRTDIREQAEKEGALVLQEARGESEKVLGAARLEAERLGQESRAEADRLVTEAKNRADELLREARDEAEKLVREAKAEAAAAVDGSRATAKRIAHDLDQLQRVRTSYLSQMKALAERHLQDIDASRNVVAPLPESVEAYMHDTDDLVDSRIKPRTTPLMSAVVPAKETITDPDTIRALTDGILPEGMMPEHSA